MPRHYEPPEDLAGTVFDPHDDTFGPIMAALQAGEFEKAAELVGFLRGGEGWDHAGGSGARPPLRDGERERLLPEVHRGARA